MKKFKLPFRFTALFFFLSLIVIRSLSQVAPVNPPTGGFNIDGTLKANTAVGDWVAGTGAGGFVLQQVAGVWGPVNSSTTKLIKDDWDNAADLIFTGSSFGDNPNTWKWTTGKATGKCDINNTLFHSTTSSTQKWILLGGDRLSITGTSYIDFQFSQGVFTRTASGFSSLAADGVTSLAATNGRTVGDFVLSMEYTSGGAVATVHYYRWELSSGSYKFVEKPIPSPGGVTSAFGASNTAVTDVPLGAFGTTSYAPFSFVEAAVNIDAILTGSCQTVSIKSIFVSTKASDSYSAALKDFVDPQPVNFVFGNAGLSYGLTSFCKQGTVAPTIPSTIAGTFSGSAGLSINGSTGVINLAGTDAGTYTATYTPTSGVCLNPATAVITINPLPAITPGTNPEVCRGSISASLSYSGATGSPTTYSIDFDATAVAAGFADVIDANLGASPISIIVPATAAAATYNGVLSVKNAAGCVSANYNITVKINPLPVANVASITLCETTQGLGTASFNLPSVNNTVTGGAGGVAVTWFSNAGLTTSIGTPSAFVSGSTTVYAKVTNTTTNCTNSAAVTLTVNSKPAITISATPASINLASGTTSQLGISSITPGAVTDYDYTWSITVLPDVSANASLTNGTTATPTLNILSPFVDGSYTVQVLATHKTNSCANTQTKIVVVSSPAAPPCNISGPSPICPGTTNTYKYDPGNDGTADAIPAGFTVLWEFTTANGATFSVAPTNSSNSVSVIAGSACNTSFTVKITLTSGTGLVSSNCSKTVTVVDATAPVFTSCPADVIIECNASTATGATGAAIATDACGSITPTYTDDIQIKGCITYITRTWKAEDACGNSATCVQRITKRDRTAPTICINGGTVTASDNCSNANDITLYLSNGVWTAIDGSGNISTSSSPAACVQQGGRINTSNQPVQEQEVVADKTKEEIVTQVSKKRIEPSQLSVQAFPNPFNDRVKFFVNSPEAGYGSLEVLNMLGQKVKTVFQGQLNAGYQSFEMSMPGGRYSTLFYILRVNDKQVTGKLIQRN